MSTKLTSNASGIEKITDTKLQKLSANIHYIVLEENDDYSVKYREQILKQILGYEPTEEVIEKVIDAALEYYQYTQFKRVMFKCTQVSFDTDTNRVNGMKFQAVVDDTGKLVLQ